MDMFVSHRAGSDITSQVVTQMDWDPNTVIRLLTRSDQSVYLSPLLSLSLTCLSVYSLSCSRWTSPSQRTACGSTGTDGTYLSSIWTGSLLWNIVWMSSCWTNCCRMRRHRRHDNIYHKTYSYNCHSHNYWNSEVNSFILSVHERDEYETRDQYVSFHLQVFYIAVY